MPNIEVLAEITDLFLKGQNLPDVVASAATISRSLFEKVKFMREKAFNDKLKIFLTETARTTDKERLRFLQELGDDPNSFWNELLTQIESIESEEKTRITSKLTHSLILRYINREQLSRLNLVIKNIHYSDLKYLNEHYKSSFQSGEKPSLFTPYDLDEEGKTVIENLVRQGLLREKSGGSVMQVALHSRLGYEVTDLGKILIKYGF